MDVSNLEPMITVGTNPGMGIMISEAIPNPDHVKDPERKAALIKALRYMDLKPGKPLLGHKVDVVFLGSCTNSRITALRMATSLLDGRKVFEKVRVLVVPGSEEIKKMAEAEGLHQRFIQAGAEWGQAG